MKAGDAIDFSLVSDAILPAAGGEVTRATEQDDRHGTDLESMFGPIQVLTDLDLLIVLETAAHERLRQACEALTRRSGVPHRYELAREDDRITMTVVSPGRRRALPPLRLRDVSRFP
jgi:hypothetical protein